ncbi:hypothetical protein NDA14_005066 [Ustilago hordei]|nr:hypothetical protein NDA14_005066 [Ustilago hordei]
MYCNYEQNDWANLLDTAAFVYNNMVHNSIGVSPFFACYGWNPKAHPDIPQQLGVNDPGRFEYLMDGKEHCKYLQEQIREAQRRSVNQYNRKHKDIKFKVGDMVYINRRNWKTRRPTPKLDTQFAGPYPVQEQVGRRAYRITLPANLRVHDVFHVSMLEPARTSSLPQRAEQPTIPSLPDEDLDFEVEALIDKRSHNGTTEYKVLWRGYSEEAASWEPVENLNCPDLIQEYEVSEGGRDLKKATLYHCTAQDWFYTNSVDALKTAKPDLQGLIKNGAWVTFDEFGTIIKQNDSTQIQYKRNRRKGQFEMQGKALALELEETLDDVPEDNQNTGRHNDIPEDDKNTGNRDNNSKEDKDSYLWHERFGHPGRDKTRQIRAHYLGTDERMDHESKHCNACSQGKQTRVQMSQSESKRAEVPLELVHVDLMTDLKGHANYHYALVAVDDFSSLIYVEPLCTKSAALLDQQGKYGARAKPAIMIGYDDKHKAWKFCNPDQPASIQWSNSATFHEDKGWSDHQQEAVWPMVTTEVEEEGVMPAAVEDLLPAVDSTVGATNTAVLNLDPMLGEAMNGEDAQLWKEAI